MEESSIELDARGTLTVTTKTKHKFTFRGRNVREMAAWKEAIESVMRCVPHVKDFFAEWKKQDSGTKDLINCLPRQAFPEKIMDGDEIHYCSILNMS